MQHGELTPKPSGLMPTNHWNPKGQWDPGTTSPLRALLLLQGEPPADVSVQFRMGGRLLEDQGMEKFALSGALSSFSKSWQCVRSPRDP